MGILLSGKGLVIVGVFLVMGGCAWFGTETSPEWLPSPERLYPSEKFLTGIGEAKTRDQAEQRAYAAVARIFSAHVQTQSMDRESYAIQESGKTNRTQRTLQLDHQTHVSSTKVLENVKVLDVWYQPSTRQFFAVAGLDRQQAEQTIMDRLKVSDGTIENLVHQGRSHPQKIQRIHGYKQAMAQLTKRALLNGDLRVIRPSGQTQPPPYQISDIEREFQHFVANEVIISVSMEGQYGEEMERAILEGLKQEGLVGSVSSTLVNGMAEMADVSIVGHLNVWTIDLPDPLFTYVRWCGDIDIYEQPSQRLIGVISETGREGHITEQEARVRANGAMQHVLSLELAHALTQSIFEEKNAEAINQTTLKACPQ
ncbi:MAG: LPP20 family lipoprotein [Nitrospirota bacterium]|nr:LPP20 family lipoprotein [Nitrospirota bacterium]